MSNKNNVVAGSGVSDSGPSASGSQGANYEYKPQARTGSGGKGDATASASGDKAASRFSSVGSLVPKTVDTVLRHTPIVRNFWSSSTDADKSTGGGGGNMSKHVATASTVDPAASTDTEGFRPKTQEIKLLPPSADAAPEEKQLDGGK
jgi:hypothetical protein